MQNLYLISEVAKKAGCHDTGRCFKQCCLNTNGYSYSQVIIQGITQLLGMRLSSPRGIDSSSTVGNE